MQNLIELSKVSPENRNENWEDQFLTELTKSKIEVMSPDPQEGPDGFPYLFVNSNESASEPSQKVIQWLAKKGIGLVVNPLKEYPDFVLTYGMLWSFVESGKFINRNQNLKSNINIDGVPINENSSNMVEFTQKQIAQFGPPTKEYLPEYVRNFLKSFLLEQGVIKPKLLLFSLDGIHFDLGISTESLGNPPNEEWTGIAEAIAWFLPPHYSIVLISEKGMPEFFDL